MGLSPTERGGAVFEYDLYERGERLCLDCGQVHDAYFIDRTNPRRGYSWASLVDGHAYRQEPWEDIARRLGFQRGD